MNNVYQRDGRAPIPRDEKTSRSMSAIRAKNTKPELLTREILKAARIRKYRLHAKNVPGRPDIAFPGKKVAIFVHGCYWHGCRYCKLPLPKTHRAFWRKKIETNRARDSHKVRELRRLGWTSITLWACRLRTQRGQDQFLRHVRGALQ